MTEPTTEQKLHSDLIGWIDGTGGDTVALHNALHFAAEDGYHVESDDDRAADIDARLDRAFEAVDQTDPDPVEVTDLTYRAAIAAETFRRGLSEDLATYEVPDAADTGAYETLGEYARHIEQQAFVIHDRAEAWAAEVES